MLPADLIASRPKVHSAAEEVELARAIEAGVLAGARLQGDPPSDMELADELRELVRIGQAAKDRMITANVGLVARVARSQTGQGLDYEDLMQEGAYGLMLAVEKFDYMRGLKFSTMATWWIRYGITIALGNTSRTVRLPRPVHAEVNRYCRARGELAGRLGREATDDELSAELDCTKHRVQDLRSWARPLVSLEAVAHEDGRAAIDIRADSSAIDPFDQVIGRESARVLTTLVQNLAEAEREFLDHWLGLSTGNPRSPQWIRRRLGLTAVEAESVEIRVREALDQAGVDFRALEVA
jgi:RNA polymerase primary sigma factor